MCAVGFLRIGFFKWKREKTQTIISYVAEDCFRLGDIVKYHTTLL